MERIKVLNKREEKKKLYYVPKEKRKISITPDPLKQIVNLREELSKSSEGISKDIVAVKSDLEKQISDLKEPKKTVKKPKKTVDEPKKTVKRARKVKQPTSWSRIDCTAFLVSGCVIGYVMVRKRNSKQRRA